MHSVRPDLSRSSSAMRSSIRADHVLESRDQSRRVGARSGGSLASLTDLVEAQAHPLGEDDEGNSAQDGARESSVPGACSLRPDQGSSS